MNTRLILTIVAGAGIMSLVLFGRGTVADQSFGNGFEKEVAQWEARVVAIGGEAAYAELARSVMSSPHYVQHEAAHAFGAALYRVEGLSGVSVCDGQFSFGCFHEFLGAAIVAHGLGSVHDLNDACRTEVPDNVLACQHGIGHGVQSYLGYTERDLDRALAICKQLPYSDPIGGCYGGVFMEYNLHTMIREGGYRLPDADPLTPCNRLDDPYQIPCVYWQTQWWHLAYQHGATSTAAYAVLGTYCQQVGTAEALVRACYEGIGNIAPASVAFDPHQAGLLCDAAAPAADPNLWCRSTVANSIGISVNPAQGEAACGVFTGESAQICIASAHNRPKEASHDDSAL